MSERPLAGVRVIDTTDGLGESAGRFLADLGADVILVEPPGGATSRNDPSLDDRPSTYFAVRNANKRGVALDTADGADLQRFHDLLDAADIWIDGGGTGVEPADVRRRRPDLVVVEISDFGACGPYRDWCASDAVHAALGGVLSRSGAPGRVPLIPPGRLLTVAASLQAALGALLAYWNRLETGVGDQLDVSVLDAVTQVMDPAFGVGGSASGGIRATSLPRGRPKSNLLYPIFPALDGHVRVALLSSRQWRGMWRWLGEPAQFGDDAWDAISYRFKNAHQLYPVIEEFLGIRTTAESVVEGQAHGVPIAAVIGAEDVLANDHFQARNAFVDVTSGDGYTVTMPNGFLELDGRRAGVDRPAPLLGQHNHEVFADLRPPRPVSGASASKGPCAPLTGLRVLDLGVIVAGAELGRMLADHGADVVKVENRAFPDGNRQSRTGETITASFTWGHRNKRGLGIDLRTSRGVTLFKELAAVTDVVLSNFKPGTMESLGIGCEVLTKINPRIVVAQSSAFGGTGPWSARMGYGPLVRASTGLTAIWQYPDDEGHFYDASTIYPDHLVGRVGAAAVVAQLIARRTTGRGGSVDISQAEIILDGLADRIARTAEAEAEAETETGTDVRAPQGVYPCAGEDEWCVIDVRSHAAWQQLCRAVDRPDLLRDPRYATAELRRQHRVLLDGELAVWTASRSPNEVMETLQSSGVAAGAMRRVGELLDDPHLRARGAYTTMSQPEVNDELPTERRTVCSLFIADPTLRPAPYVGEHSREICAEWLGLGDEDIDALVEAGALEQLDTNERSRT